MDLSLEPVLQRDVGCFSQKECAVVPSPDELPSQLAL
jgi:hypothetical protein